MRTMTARHASEKERSWRSGVAWKTSCMPYTRSLRTPADAKIRKLVRTNAPLRTPVAASQCRFSLSLSLSLFFRFFAVRLLSRLSGKRYRIAVRCGVVCLMWCCVVWGARTQNFRKGEIVTYLRNGGPPSKTGTCAYSLASRGILLLLRRKEQNNQDAREFPPFNPPPVPGTVTVCCRTPALSYPSTPLRPVVPTYQPCRTVQHTLRRGKPLAVTDAPTRPSCHRRRPPFRAQCRLPRIVLHLLPRRACIERHGFLLLLLLLQPSPLTLQSHHSPSPPARTPPPERSGNANPNSAPLQVGFPDSASLPPLGRCASEAGLLGASCPICRTDLLPQTIPASGAAADGYPPAGAPILMTQLPLSDHLPTINNPRGPRAGRGAGHQQGSQGICRSAEAAAASHPAVPSQAPLHSSRIRPAAAPRRWGKPRMGTPRPAPPSVWLRSTGAPAATRDTPQPISMLQQYTYPSTASPPMATRPSRAVLTRRHAHTHTYIHTHTHTNVGGAGICRSFTPLGPLPLCCQPVANYWGLITQAEDGRELTWAGSQAKERGRPLAGIAPFIGRTARTQATAAAPPQGRPRCTCHATRAR
ncbi:hypothetical protein PLESTM_001355800 [Pleodorina starrii]|nr:hypothetical protein PLESTM_001355800 [Pleodorina starrii]